LRQGNNDWETGQRGFLGYAKYKAMFFFFFPQKNSVSHTLRVCGFSFMLYFNMKFTFLKEVLEGQEGQTQFHQELLTGSEVCHPSRVLASSVLLASAAF